MVHEMDFLLDGLASRLRRSVLVADRQQRLISYSAGHADADAIRVATILNRASPAPMQEFVSSLGIDRRREITRAPANRELGSEPRLCIPLHHSDRLLGFLWLIDSNEDISKADLRTARDEADEAADILFRIERLEDEARSRERGLLEALLSPDADMRSHAAASTRSAFEFSGFARAVVVGPVGSDLDLDSGPDLAAIEDRARRLWSTRRLLSLSREDHCILLLACSVDDDVQVRGFATRIRSMLAKERATLGDCVVGVGGLRELESAALSYQEAVQATTVARAIPSFSGIADWDSLGAYRVLTAIQSPTSAIDPMVTRLLAADDGTLVQTLEKYLDLAGDAKATSSELVLHRTSLYYRLRKAETIIGASLRDGDVRLVLQLGLKLARLNGMLPDPVQQG